MEDANKSIFDVPELVLLSSRIQVYKNWKGNRDGYIKNLYSYIIPKCKFLQWNK